MSLSFPKILSMLKEKGMDDVLLTGGGIIPEDDIPELKKWKKLSLKF